MKLLTKAQFIALAAARGYEVTDHRTACRADAALRREGVTIGTAALHEHWPSTRRAFAVAPRGAA